MLEWCLGNVDNVYRIGFSESMRVCWEERTVLPQFSGLVQEALSELMHCAPSNRRRNCPNVLSKV